MITLPPLDNLLHRRSLLAMPLLGLMGAPVARACMHLPPGYEGSIGQNTQEGVLIHSDGREQLILRVNYRIDGKKPAPNFAWIVTVPKEPDAYKLADPKLFKDMFNLSQKLLRPKPDEKNKLNAPRLGSANILEEKQSGVELGKRAVVGPYDIQPVRGVGAHALKGLNQWMIKNGFEPMAADHMAYFVDNGFTFLAIKVNGARGAQGVAAGGMLPPLAFSFASEQPYYPMKFSSHQGTFDLNLHILSTQKFDYKANEELLRRVRWSNRSWKRNASLKRSAMPKTLVKHVPADKPSQMWFYNNIKGSRINRNGEIAKWKTDLFFANAKTAHPAGETSKKPAKG